MKHEPDWWLWSPETAARIRKERAEKIKCVDDFGALGDGVTDDTAAFQRAIDSFTTPDE